MEEVLKQFGFESAQPQTFVLKGNPMNFMTWKKELSARMNKDV